MRKLDHWIRAYMRYTRHLEAPDAFHFWTAVYTLAGALQGKTWIDMGFFKWKPNFFIIFVAPPGIATKSTTIRVGTQLLSQVDNVHFGPKSITWQFIVDALYNSKELYQTQQGEDIETSSITCVATELGTFLDPKNQFLIDALVDLWDGQDEGWGRGTKGEGEKIISNPWINIVGACTPSWIAESFPEYAIGGGFVSRTVFVFAEGKRNLVPYPKYDQDTEDEGLKADLIHDLQEIARMTGEFVLTDDALEWGRKWYEELWKNRPSHLSNERMASYVARKQTHIHKLAMVISAAQRTSQSITQEDLETANELMTAIEKSMHRVFDQVTDNTYARYAQAILGTLRVSGKLSKQDLWRDLFHMMAHDDFEKALMACQQAGYVELRDNGSDLIVVPHLSTTDQGPDTDAATFSR